MAQGGRIAPAGTEGMVFDDCWVLHCGGPCCADRRSGDPHCAHSRSKQYFDWNSCHGNLCWEDMEAEGGDYEDVDDKASEVEVPCVSLCLRIRVECRIVGHTVTLVEDLAMTQGNSYDWTEDLHGWATDNSMAHRNEAGWGSYLLSGVGCLRLPSRFGHSNGRGFSWRLTVVRGEREWRIEDRLDSPSQTHEAAIKPVRSEVVYQPEAVTQTLACMFGTDGEHILRFELAAGVLVPTWEDRWVVVSVEKVPLRSLDASFPRVMKPIRAWLEASEGVVFFLRVLSVLDSIIHVSSRTS